MAPETTSTVTSNTTSQSNSTSIAVLVDHPECENFRFIFYTIVLGCVCFFGFLGNSVSFYILRRDAANPVASFQLQCLAVIDNILLLLWCIHYSIRYTIIYFGAGGNLLQSIWLVIRIYTFPVLFMSQTATIYLTVVIAIGRYVAVCLPYLAVNLTMRSMTYIRSAVFSVAVFSFLYNVPRFFELKITGMDDRGLLQWDWTDLSKDPTYTLVYTKILYFLITFAFPILSLTVMNSRIIVNYREISRRKRRLRNFSSQQSTSMESSENNITLVMIVIILVFIICQLPSRLIQLIWNYQYSDCREPMFYIFHISNALEVLNSSVNFLIYVTYHRLFRRIFISESACRRCRTALLSGGSGSESRRVVTLIRKIEVEVDTGSPRQNKTHVDHMSNSDCHAKLSSIDVPLPVLTTCTSVVLLSTSGEDDCVPESATET